MKTSTKVALAGAGIVALGVVLLVSRSDGPSAAAACGELTSTQLEGEALRMAEEATLAAPPGWDFCTMPSYYTRACEACPYTLRWSGPAPGTCPTIAICGAHTKPCGGDDGITYAMMDQGGTRYYPQPQVSAGATIRNLWDLCYIQKQNIWGSAYPCSAVVNPPGGSQAPQMITWNQLPEGGQKAAWGIKYGCGPYAPTPTAGATTPVPTVVPPPLTPTGGVPPACPTCAPTCAPPTKTKTITPHIGPILTKTFTPVIGPAKSHTPTRTPCLGPSSGCPTPTP